jgi:phospholipid transport system substrate-binding protein
MLRSRQLHTIVIPALLAFHSQAGAQDLAAVARLAEAPTAVASDAAIDQPTRAPIEVVETLHGALLELMKQADDLGFEGRYDRIEPVVADVFDLGFMGSKCVGRYWKKLSPEEQALWLTKFGNLVAANYAGNFDRYDGETFETLGEEPGARSTRVVLTRVVVPKEDDVILNYRLREIDGEWQIIDVYLKGTVSELALRRSDFSAALKKDGFAKLTVAVDEKIASIREKNGG